MGTSMRTIILLVALTACGETYVSAPMGGENPPAAPTYCVICKIEERCIQDAYQFCSDMGSTNIIVDNQGWSGPSPDKEVYHVFFQCPGMSTTPWHPKWRGGI